MCGREGGREGGVGLLGKKGEGQLISECLTLMIHPHQGGEGTRERGGVFRSGPRESTANVSSSALPAGVAASHPETETVCLQINKSSEKAKSTLTSSSKE